MSHSCQNETVLFQSLVAYGAAEEQFVLWPTRVPTALPGRGVHLYRDLPTFGDSLVSQAALIKPKTVIRGPTMSKDGAKQFVAIYRANIARRHPVLWSICWSSSRYRPFYVYTLTWSSTSRCRQAPSKPCR